VIIALYESTFTIPYHDDVPTPGRHCSSVSDSTLDTSLSDCVTTASSLGCQPSTDSSATSAGYIRWSGVRCRRSVYVELTAETFIYATLLTALLFLAVFSKHSSSQSTIQGFGEDALCKLTFYITLHYKETVSYCHSGCNKLSLCPHHIVSFIILHI